MSSPTSSHERGGLPAGARIVADALEPVGRTCRYVTGERIFRQGDAGGFVVLVTSGMVQVSALDTQGHEVVLGRRGPGDLIGELAAIDAVPRMADAVAVDDVVAIVVPAADFVSVLERQPGVALAVLRGLVGRLRDADRRGFEYGGLDTTTRVARTLVGLAEEGAVASHGPIELGLSQEDLGRHVHASRESVVRALSRLREAGLVSTSRRRVTVLDLEGLRTRGSAAGA